MLLKGTSFDTEKAKYCLPHVNMCPKYGEDLEMPETQLTDYREWKKDTFHRSDKLRATLTKCVLAISVNYC